MSRADSMFPRMYPDRATVVPAPIPPARWLPLAKKYRMDICFNSNVVSSACDAPVNAVEFFGADWTHYDVGAAVLAVAAKLGDVQPVFQRLTAAGQVRKGDMVRFDLCGEQKEHKVAEVLHPGTDREEIIYHRRNNWYLITSMSIKNQGSQKNVEFKPKGGAQ